MTKYLVEPCQPYAVGHPGQPDPIRFSTILDRLSEYELRRLAIALSVVRPDVFEERILEMWAQRSAPDQVKDQGSQVTGG